MTELVRRGSYDPVPVSRGAAKRLGRIQEEAAITQAVIAAQAQESRAILNAGERARYSLALQRIEGGYDLADHATDHAIYLSHKINQASRDNPGLEMELRGIEETAALGARLVIHHYITGR
jgi:hypothetical protein